ncbi:hypothetical protein GCM10011316_17940 [Roseibium aquae]|uniref:Uncharacterized protein n=1 Tax=Roseibium aquae TaxID=1323746 RepID=A0A916WZS0_9HYPH|nr:hypothetical protein GCM10011316_17940 [Roseibium aquae]
MAGQLGLVHHKAIGGKADIRCSKAAENIEQDHKPNHPSQHEKAQARQENAQNPDQPGMPPGCPLSAGFSVPE